MTNVSIIGTSRIMEEHIKACQKLKINIIGIYSTSTGTKSLDYLAKKYKILKFKNLNQFLSYSRRKKSHFILAPRLVDNEKLIKKCLKIGTKIFIEKPVFLNHRKFKNYLQHDNRFFVGFNRIFYRNVNFLKKRLNNKKNEILVICPEKNKTSIVSNSCHIISILYYIFGKLNIIYKRKNRNQIYCILKSKLSFITIIFHFKSKDLFRIESFNKKEKIIMSPIENLKIFKNLFVTKYKNNNIYSLNKTLEINEFNYTKIKPGFLDQMQNFKLFIKNKKKIINNLTFSSEIVKICNEIIS